MRRMCRERAATPCAWRERRVIATVMRALDGAPSDPYIEANLWMRIR